MESMLHVRIDPLDQMENLRQFFVDPRIDKPWGNTLREKLHEPCTCGIQIGGANERQQAPSHRSTSSSSSGAPSLARRIASSRGFGVIIQQLGELRVQSDNIQDTLHQHIETSQAWQCHTGERLHDMEQRQLQHQEEWRAYCHWTGFNPDQQQ